jgi:Ser/Thr protein kinase RdoA (MazF antagonist)
LRIEQPNQQGVNNLGLLVHTSSETLRCKIYTHIHEPAALRYEHNLLLRLTARGCSFGLPTPRRARDGSTLQPSALGWLALFPDLSGAPMDPDDLGQIHALGAAIGELHSALAELPAIPRPGHALFTYFFDFPLPACNPFDLYPASIGAAETPAAREVCAWWRTAARQLDFYAKHDFRQLPSQLCHNDLAPYNILVRAGRISAVLDFEFAGVAPAAFDLAMALRMTMRTWENPDPWAAARLLCQGYRGWAGLTTQECAQLPALIRL